MFQTKVAEKIKTHILYSITFLRSRAKNIYKNMLRADSPLTTA